MKLFAFISSLLHSPGMPVCGDEELPPVDFNFCVPDARLSEIRRIFIAKTGAKPFTDWNDCHEWVDRISNTSEDIDAIRVLTVVGDKPLPNTTRRDISFQRKRTTLRQHSLNATIDEITPSNHLFISNLQSGKKYRIWYETWGMFMFGGNDGIIATLTGDMVLPRGQGEITTYELLAAWNNLMTEDRILSPIFDEVCICEDPVVDVIEGLGDVYEGDTITLTDATPDGVWSSDNEAVATVDPVTGVVTGVAEGEANIIYTVTNDCGSSGTFQHGVAVHALADLPAITGLAGAINLWANNASGAPTSRTAANTEAGGTWSTSDAAIATVDPVTGVVTAGTTPGNVTITYSKIGFTPATAIVLVTAIWALSLTGTTYPVSMNVFVPAAPGGVWVGISSTGHIIVSGAYPNYIFTANTLQLSEDSESYRIGGVGVFNTFGVVEA